MPTSPASTAGLRTTSRPVVEPSASASPRAPTASVVCSVSSTRSTAAPRSAARRRPRAARPSPAAPARSTTRSSSATSASSTTATRRRSTRPPRRARPTPASCQAPPAQSGGPPKWWDAGKDGAFHSVFDGHVVSVNGQPTKCRTLPVDYAQWSRLRAPSDGTNGTADETNGGFYQGNNSVEPGTGRQRVPYSVRHGRVGRHRQRFGLPLRRGRRHVRAGQLRDEPPGRPPRHPGQLPPQQGDVQRPRRAGSLVLSLQREALRHRQRRRVPTGTSTRISLENGGALRRWSGHSLLTPSGPWSFDRAAARQHAGCFGRLRRLHAPALAARAWRSLRHGGRVQRPDPPVGI